LRKRDGGGPAAAPHIDDPLSCSGLDAIDQNVRDRRQDGVLRLLAIRPVLASQSVPECDLIRILIVACRCFHLPKPPLR
jgi:hypothetical protein